VRALVIVADTSLFRDGRFTTVQGFVTFLNPGADGRM
jgi:hypothetical protein